MTNELDIDDLLNALDNEENESIMNLNSSSIKQAKNDILQRLQLDKETIKSFHKKLKNYRWVDELKDIQYGAYIRWINIRNPNNLKLTNGGIICDMQILENGVHIKCKNNINRIFQIIMNENIIFQKLTFQEEILLSAMNYLQQ